MLFGSMTQEDLMQLIVKVFAILMILPLHEFAHAWTAHKLGDDTAMYQGRLTLNPFAHLDPIGTLCMLFVGFGWAKPVPINPARFNRKHSIRFGVAITALAGPLSNLIAALVGMVIYRFYLLSDMYVQYWESYYAEETVNNAPMLIATMLYAFVSINIGLCVFNLIPIPPLDGSKILSYFTSAKVDRWFIEHEQIVRIVFLILLVSPVLSIPMSYISGKLFDLMVFLTGWIPMLFG